MIKIELSWGRLFFDCMLNIQSVLKIFRYWSLFVDLTVFAYWWSYCYQKRNSLFTKYSWIAILTEDVFKISKSGKKRNCGKIGERSQKKRQFSTKSGRSGNPAWVPFRVTWGIFLEFFQKYWEQSSRPFLVHLRWSFGMLSGTPRTIIQSTSEDA